jgi:ABC-type antimicrobial peptide transport system permease subunit
VVADTRDGGLDAASGYAVFFPSATGMYYPGAGAGLVIRSAGDAAALVPAVTSITRRVAPTAAIENVKTVPQIKDDSVAPRRLNAALVSLFGTLALIMAAVGIAGVLAFSVSARTNEIGIRMSLGADGTRVQRMILREGGVLVALGLVLGVVGGAAGAGVIRGLLFGIEPHDPTTFGSVALMMAAIGIGACWIPALRAARVDPAVTMRSD